MTQIQGMLSLEALRDQIASGAIDTVLVAMTDLYGRMLGKRYDAHFFLESAVEGGAHFCDYLFTADMRMTPVPGYAYTNWEKGYGDVHLQPDMSTLRVLSWMERTALVQCDALNSSGPQDAAHDYLNIAPRSILRAQVERAARLGLQVMAATELEFYVYKTPYEEGATSGFRDMQPAGWVIEDYHVLQSSRGEDFIGALRRHMRDSGVPVENSKGEWGHGQHELNVRYSDVLTMADRHAVYKQCAKEVAQRMDRSVTFMAKPTADQAGSSCHIHMSLWRDGENAFAAGAPCTDLGGVNCTPLFQRFLAGWMKHAPDVMPFYAPNVNSYKRYQAGSWAPTKVAWSYDNRTAGFRVVGAGKSLRIECRIPGADCNPYLALAASLASGLDGVERELNPPEAFHGDLYKASDLLEVPTNPRSALALWRDSSFVRATFGQDVHEHYRHFFDQEIKAYDTAVTDWERARYFEQI